MVVGAHIDDMILGILFNSASTYNTDKRRLAANIQVRKPYYYIEYQDQNEKQTTANNSHKFRRASNVYKYCKALHGYND